MAGGQERVLRRRIKSVNSTKKITRAMELIATTRIAKAQARVIAARPYAEQITSVIRSLAAVEPPRVNRCLPPRLKSKRSRMWCWPLTADWPVRSTPQSFV